MEPTFVLDVLSRIFHVGTAIVLAGGSVYTLLVLLPALRTLDLTTKQMVVGGVTRYWKPFVMGGTLLLLVTGFYNYFRQMPLHKGDGLYHALIGIKMILAFGIFFMAAALVGRSPKLQSMRDNRVRWLGLIVLSAALIVAISGILKVRGAAPLVENAVDPVEQATPAQPLTAQ